VPPPPPPPPPPPAPPKRRRQRHHAAAATAAATAATAAAATPPPPPVDKVHPFVMGGFGKERRVRETEVANPTPLAALIEDNGICAPLIGIKGGVMFDVKPNFVVAPAVGVAFNLDDGGNSSIFAEVELNYVYSGGAYIGTGVGVWDFNHSDNVAPSLLVHFGVPIAKPAEGPPTLYFIGEGRLFMDQFDDIANNYQFWGGIRCVFR
jgi:hypothetical protein